ncbi:TlpA disulfide reductase family protein [Fulvivirgaceae bacterium BMA12]|uniref:TlpA disulfide reductase family protein n=1 Tax=Agaribacillus aureus TaxID=3051825 RepID=A0ABT8LJ18_9BACT|nr:TlpA disulfide reductase family protein [Fulvivirgaceae bacterium BMA12]
MKYLGLIIFTLLISTSCQKNDTTDGYLINGVARNIPDSTAILMYLDTNTILDSTIIVNETFQFKGKVERPTRVMLRIKSTRDRRMFWLENHKIDITGEKGNLINGEIVGSITQKEAELLLDRKDSIFKEMNRIEAMVTDKNRDSLFVIYNQMIDKEVEINKNFIEDYPDSYESITILTNSKEKLGPAETGRLLSLMNKELQSTDEGKSITHFIELNKSPQVGEKYVDFEQTNIEGQPIRFSEIKGKYTLLEFWSSYCGPCRAENPELVKEYERYKDKGFVIFGVSLDAKKENWIKAIEKDGLTWENVSDLKGGDNEAAMIYGVGDLPDNFLIDENGIIIARYIRGDNLKKKLKALFEEEVSL